MLTLRERWDYLVTAILEEYSGHSFDSNFNFVHDFATRQVRLRRLSGDGDEWLVRTLADDELRNGDLDAIAQELWAASRAPAE